MTADRQDGQAAIDTELAALGVERVAIPRKGQAGRARQAHEHTRGFRRLVKWRTGSPGRISHLKHRHGWDRTLMDGIDGVRIWCGHGVFAHNLVKIGACWRPSSSSNWQREPGHHPVPRHARDPPPQRWDHRRPVSPQSATVRGPSGRSN